MNLEKTKHGLPTYCMHRSGGWEEIMKMKLKLLFMLRGRQIGWVSLLLVDFIVYRGAE
jgi:hypothetical protein